MKNLPRLLLAVLASLLLAHAQAPLRVVNNASANPDDFTPGTLISILGSNLSPVMAGTPDQVTPFTLFDGVSVKIGGVPAGLFYISANQITALIDPATPVGPTTLSVFGPTFNGSANITIRSTVAPGLYATSNAGTRDAAAINGTMFGFAPFSVTSGGGQPTYLGLFATGLDLSTAPAVTIGGLPAAVQFYGPEPCCLGMEQINVAIPPALAGAGRVEILATSGSVASNVVETVILPNVGQGPYPPTAENAPRNREIGAVAVMPMVGQALVLDEKDDVVRVIDVRQRAVVRTIALAAGAQPFSIAVNDNGALAVVAERGRAKAAFINLNQGVVLSEVAVDPGLSSVVLTGDTALVASQDTDMVTLLSVSQRAVLGTIPVGRAPRSLALDPNTYLLYVANQNDGTIGVIDIARRAVVDSFRLGSNARPQTVRLLPNNVLAVTEPNAGVIDLIDLGSRNITQTQTTATDLAFSDTTAYVANQIGATASGMPIDAFPRGGLPGSGFTLSLDPGVRGLAVDATDHLLLVSSESSGMVSLIDTTGNRLIGSINAAPDDRTTAANLPLITSMAPRQAPAGSTVQLTVNGAPLGGTFNAYFVRADGSIDPAFQISNMQVESTGQQITLTLQISADAAKGDHVLRVFTPNGESTPTSQTTNVLTVL